MGGLGRHRLAYLRIPYLPYPPYLPYSKLAIKSISTRTSRGSLATWTVARAGYGSRSTSHATSSTAANSPMSARNTARSHDVRERQAGGGEDRVKILHHAPRLSSDIAFDHRPGRRIERDLPGCKEELPGANSLRIRADRLRSIWTRNGALGHAATDERLTTNDYAALTTLFELNTACRRGSAGCPR